MKKKILLLVLLVVILLGAGVAYAYFATDAFKTEKEIFFSYLLKDDPEEVKEIDNKFFEYFAKKETTPYENDGEATITVNSDDMTTTGGINNIKVDFEGKTDATKKLAEQTISVDLSQGFIIPIEFKREGETYGIQSDFLDTRFVAIRNEGLKALAERFGMDATMIPDKIDLGNFSFTLEEINTLVEKYINILSDNLEEELFTKEKVNSETIVTLNMPEAKVKEVFIKILEALKEDEIILSKLPEATKTQFQDYLQQAIEELGQIETSENNYFEVKMYIESRNIKKIEMVVIQENEAVSTIVMDIIDPYTITMKMYEGTELIMEETIAVQKAENDLVMTATYKLEQDGVLMEMDIDMQYKNLFTSENVQEIMNIEIKQQVEGDGEYYADTNTQTTLNYQNDITFTPDLQIEAFNEENAIIINDATDEELQTLLLGIYQKLGLM